MRCDNVIIILKALGKDSHQSQFSIEEIVVIRNGYNCDRNSIHFNSKIISKYRVTRNVQITRNILEQT